MRVSALCTAVLTVAVAACAAPVTSTSPQVQTTAATDAGVRNIILLIADGAGAGVWTAAVYAEHDLAVRRMPVVGLVDSRSSNARVTDSAAGSTAYATGKRVGNRTIGVGGACPLPSSRDTTATAWPDGCERLTSWFTMARDKGRATGLVTTTSIIDATPASFIAHSPSRYWREAIAEQFAVADLDVMLGGGRRYFDNRTDRRNLLAALCAHADCINSDAELAAYRGGDRPLIGLFAAEDMDDIQPRTITLPQMVDAALTKLARNSAGFVAVFETEATDNDTHANLPLDRITADILEFDRAVASALEFARRTPGTLVIATSDHETGGFSLVQTGLDFELRYTTTGHTATLVPLFASGPQASRFGGLRDNTEIGQALMDIVEGW